MARKGLAQDRTFVAKDKEYLNPLKRAELEKKIASLEFNARNIDNQIDPSKPWLYNPKATNVGDLRKEIAKAKKTITKRTPPEVNASTKNALYKRFKALEKEITKELPTKDEMMGKRYSPIDGKPYVVASEHAIKKQMDWQLKQAANVREWKQIGRILEPLDPNFCNIERLRR